jgi:hypothetical protein
MSTKPEFPPLPPLGFHQMDPDSVRRICVDAFPGSSTRGEIMRKLEEVIQVITAVGLKVNIWLDGSFLTQKLDPEDSDIVVVVDGVYIRAATTEQKTVIDWILANLKTSHYCDSYLLVQYPSDHPNFMNGIWWQSYWIKHFGFTREEKPQPKGIVLIHVE